MEPCCGWLRGKGIQPPEAVPNFEKLPYMSPYMRPSGVPAGTGRASTPCLRSAQDTFDFANQLKLTEEQVNQSPP